MRLKVEINDLTPEQWEQAQKILKAEYTIPDGASRVCLTLIHGNEERHVETPVGALTGLLTGLNLGQAFRGLSQAIKTAMAALTPDDPALPRGFEPEFKSPAGHTSTGDVTAQDTTPLDYYRLPWPDGEPEEDQENQRAEDSEVEEFLADRDSDA